MTSCLCRTVLFCAVFHVAFSANCKNVKATTDELNVLEKKHCATAIETIGIDRKYFDSTADKKLSCLSEKLSLSMQNAEGSITCSCPVGWTDSVFDDDSYPLGVGEVAKSNLPEMHCAIPCSEESFKILSVLVLWMDETKIVSNDCYHFDECLKFFILWKLRTC